MKEKYWKHKRTIEIEGIYHRCQKCNELVNDSAIVVMTISPTGDKITIYCSQKCFDNDG